MKLPKYIVVIIYKPLTFQIEKRNHVGPPLTKCIRTMFIYNQDELDKRMSKAWKPEAEAKVYSANYREEGSFKASKMKGVWS